MNLQSSKKNGVEAICFAATVPAVSSDAGRMVFRPIQIKSLILVAVAIIVSTCNLLAQTNYYGANGGEFAVVGALPGDQMFPDVALSTNGGFIVWQDNATDGDGWGLSATRVDESLTPVITWQDQRVNVQGTGNQENPHVGMLKNGGAVFVWQGGPQGDQHIWARYLTAANTWLATTDLLVSTFTDTFQANPAVAVLANGNVVVVWSSFNQAGANSLMDVYAKVLSPVGATVKSDFLVNQALDYNQRTPTVTALANGGFAIAWISEQQRLVAPNVATNGSGYFMASAAALPSVDVYARLFQADGLASGGEFLVNQSFAPCANPAIAGASDGSFTVAWSGRDVVTYTNGWDVYARSFSAAGTGGNVALMNTHAAGNQYSPRLVSIGLDYMVLWTSLDQDGSREGVYGRFIHGAETPTSDEFCVNTTIASQQMQPVVAADGTGQFLTVWTSFVGGYSSFDLYAQRYENVNGVLLPMPAPFVYAPFTLSNNIYQPQLQVSWSPLLGISVSNYLVYVDGAATNMAVTASNMWVMTAANGLTTNSTHSFQVTYVRMDGRVAPLSPSASGTTWSGLNWGGIPYEWMANYFGGYYSGAYHTNFWMSPSTKLAPGGLALDQVFLSGGDPYDSTTWLTTSLAKTSQGFFVNWNTQPGFTYQVMVSTNLVSWQNVGAPRFAAGTNDTIFVGAGSAGYYRVYLLR